MIKEAVPEISSVSVVTGVSDDLYAQAKALLARQH
jgi:hypothetical protein